MAALVSDIDLACRIVADQHHGETGARLATTEMMMLNIDSAGPKAAPFLPEVKAKLDAIFAAHKGLARPKEVGRSIGIRR